MDKARRLAEGRSGNLCFGFPMFQRPKRSCRSMSRVRKDQPYTTGFQTSLLTPILNAMRPDDFMIVNNKSRRLINYFTDAAFEQRLTDYPGTNDAGRALVAEFTERMREADTECRASSRFIRHFRDWLVAIRKHPFGRVRYWKSAPGENAYLWDEWHKNGYAAIGWDELGDMSDISRNEFDRRVERVREAHPDWTKVRLQPSVGFCSHQGRRSDRH